MSSKRTTANYLGIALQLVELKMNSHWFLIWLNDSITIFIQDTGIKVHFSQSN